VEAPLVVGPPGSDGDGVARAKKTAPAEAPPSSRREDARRRRTAEEARAAILDAAERRLVTSGPAGIRLQEVAADVGMSHPTVLHHFGSREALVKEVCERRFAAIHADVARALAEGDGGAEEATGILDSVFHALESHGHGRVVFWLALEGLLDKREELRLHDIGRALHALRARKRGARGVPLDDTLHVVALASLALLAESVLGRSILRDAGLGEDRAARARFRAWLARLLSDHLQSGPRA
jgi:AcrR family transcriptional regulator